MLHTLQLRQFSKIQKIRFEQVYLFMSSHREAKLLGSGGRTAQFPLHYKQVWQIFSWKSPRLIPFQSSILKTDYMFLQFTMQICLKKILGVSKFQVPFKISVSFEKLIHGVNRNVRN